MDKLYMTIEEAAAYVGIGINTMRNYANSKDPPPYLLIGKKKLLQVAALADYFHERQEVK